MRQIEKNNSELTGRRASEIKLINSPERGLPNIDTYVNSGSAIYNRDGEIWPCEIFGMRKSKYEWIQIRGHIASKRNNTKSKIEQKAFRKVPKMTPQ